MNVSIAIRLLPILVVSVGLSVSEAQIVPPVALSQIASPTNNQVTLAWPAVAGATSYNVKRSLMPGGPHAQLGAVATTNYTDAAALPGTNYFYAVTTVSNAVESAAFREVQAMACVVGDNSDALGVTFTGTWSVSAVAGYYGVNSVFAPTTNGSVPSATCTFTPTLPLTANYDIYLRWTANANRPNNAPVDIVFADNQTTVTVDQTVNGGTWMLLGTFPCEAGNSNRVTIRNNTGTTGKSVIADAVQFVPHLSPWGNATNTLADYTLTTFADNISGTSLDATKWGIALGRPNVSVADGKISLDIEYIGATPIAQATPAELKDVNNWNKGAVQPLNDQKFGYYEARFRVNQDGGGVDNAFWFPASMEAGHWEGYEYDVPEIFTQPVPNFGNTDVGYGIWNHVNGAHIWTATNESWPSYNNVGNSWGLTNYHTFGFEWRTDNSLVIYLDGVQLSRAQPSKVNELATILPAVPVLSTWVGDWMQPTTNLDGQSMKIDYLRCYQKPGWLGAVSSAWTNTANWGPDGIPGAGYAAVFNMNAPQSTVTLPTNQPVQSLSFDHPNLSATTINGPGALLLGAGTNNVLNGGIAMGSFTTTTQTVNVAIIAQKDLSFLNNSGNGAPLLLNGTISGDGVSPRDIHFICGAPILVSQPLLGTIGEVVVWGGTVFGLPTNCTYAGRTVIDTTTLVAGKISNGGQPSSLGVSSANATNLLFYSNRTHSEPFRPRLRYTGSGDVSDRGILITPAAEGILEASGTGPLTLTGAVILDPERLITGNTNNAPSLILGGTNTDNNTLASDFISTNGMNLTLKKSDAGTWVLTGDIVLSNNFSVTGGRLQIGSGTNGSLVANSVPVSSGAEFTLGRDDNLAFAVPITGSGGFRKLGAGQLTLTGANTYSGTTTVDAGTLINVNTGTGALTVNGGVFDLNGANRNAGVVVLNGGSITNSSGGNSFYLAGSSVDLQSGSISARLGGFGSVVKTTPGSVTLTGGNTFLGGTTVSNGTLTLKSPGTLASAVVLEGGVFGGNGTVDDALTINGGIHAPGTSAGIMTVNSNYTLNVGGTLRMELLGTAPVTQYDQVKVAGAGSLVTLAGSLEIVTTNTLGVGATFGIITNTGSLAVSGTFANRPQGSGFVAGNTNWFRISYTGGSGNDVFLTRIATPGAPTMSASLSNGLPRLTFAGATNVNYQVLASTNLLDWAPVLSTNPPALPFVWIDSAATSFPARFYRVSIGL